MPASAITPNGSAVHATNSHSNTNGTDHVNKPAFGTAHNYTGTGFGTRAIHSGTVPDPITGAVTVPISLATTFVQRSPGEHTGYEYSRTGNPTRAAFEQNIAALEEGKYGLAFASGSAATVTIINTLPSGSHVITIDDVYGGTNRYFNKVAAVTNNIEFDFVDVSDQKALNAAVKPNTKLLWIETPTNPTLKVTDIQAISTWARSKGLITVVDNTFASPFLQQPLKLGADIVVHSVTKYLGGHSDVVMGVLATSNEELYTKLKFLQNSIGAIPAPFDCYMALRGVKTLHLRMQRHSENALKIAQLLEKHPLVTKVIYPGLPSHAQHELATRQLRNYHGKTYYGGMITFFLKGGITESKQFLENLRVFALAESLGAVESLAEHPAIMTHAAVPAEQRKLLGISDSLIRLSVGVEDIEDLEQDINRALDAVKSQ